MKKTRVRADELLVLRGLAPTRAKAKACLMAGQVFVEGRAQTKAGILIDEDAAIEVRSPCPYVSRGGLKLAAALKGLGVSPRGRVCLDVGASTGGFTDCLLQEGAARVYAVDVGHGQLHAKIAADSRVVSIEKTHARSLDPALFAPAPDFATADVSFISLTLVLPAIASCLKSPWVLLALVKPQFEVGPKLAPKGVVRDPAARAAALAKIREAAAALGLRETGVFESPVHGPKGNIETFIRLASPIAQSWEIY
ncbi:MAG: TlyA family RNA methyltransferase [Elusimicrobia bacterium]|nr:TlyA family RNA methyltransferase [Elusimicrobiota bacterium]MDE2312673.1 TlyA family RNA methyltransferase [Elusimicrobiota bacterium]